MADKWGGLAQGISRGIHDYATLERMKNEKSRYDSMAAMDKERMGLEREKVGLLKDQSQRSAADWAFWNDRITTAGQYLKGQGLTDEDIQTAVSIFPGVNADTQLSRKDLENMATWLEKNPQAKLQFGRKVLDSLGKQLGTLDPKSDEYNTLKQQIDAQKVQIFGKPEKAEKPSTFMEQYNAARKIYGDEKALQMVLGEKGGKDKFDFNVPAATIEDLGKKLTDIYREKANAMKSAYKDKNGLWVYKDKYDAEVFDGMSEDEWITNQVSKELNKQVKIMKSGKGEQMPVPSLRQGTPAESTGKPEAPQGKATGGTPEDVMLAMIKKATATPEATPEAQKPAPKPEVRPEPKASSKTESAPPPAVEPGKEGFFKRETGTEVDNRAYTAYLKNKLNNYTKSLNSPRLSKYQKANVRKAIADIEKELSELNPIIAQ